MNQKLHSWKHLILKSKSHISILDGLKKYLEETKIYVVPRTSDSLNEGLPIKMTREKFQRK